jgi:tetratricopeptide (TPR) repeat protein
MSRGLTSEARADFDKAVAINPKFAAALNNRGLLLLTTPDYKAAEADFSLAIEADRNFADGWNNRGFARMKQGQLETALADVRQALRLKETDITAWNNQGLIEMQMEQFDAARASFTRAVELDPMDARWLNHRRSALLKLNQFAEAQQDARQIEWLVRLTELTDQAGRHARNPNAWITRARHLMDGDQFGAAVQDFTRALLVSPGHHEALAGRAAAWVRAGDFQKAMLDVDESLVANPSQEAYSLRGDLWLRLEHLDQAIADFESAGRFDEQVAVAYEKRAEQHRGEGDAGAAEADAAKARDIRTALADDARPDTPSATRTAEGFDPSAGP